jgi:hypothetical protein
MTADPSKLANSTPFAARAFESCLAWQAVAPGTAETKEPTPKQPVRMRLIKGTKYQFKTID